MNPNTHYTPQPPYQPQPILPQEKGKINPLVWCGLVASVLSMGSAILGYWVELSQYASFFISFMSIIIGIGSLTMIKNGGSSGMGLAIVSIVFSVVALLSASGMYIIRVAMSDTGLKSSTQKSSHEKYDVKWDNSSADVEAPDTAKILKDYVDVQFGQLQVIDENKLPTTSMQVTIKSKAPKSATFNFTVEALNKNNERIAEDHVMATDLAPGQTAKDEVFTFISKNKIQEMKEAKINVVRATMYLNSY